MFAKCEMNLNYDLLIKKCGLEERYKLPGTRRSPEFISLDPFLINPLTGQRLVLYYGEWFSAGSD